jgi:hypothetical protein
MEKRINKKITNYLTESKNLIRESIHQTIKNLETDFNNFDNKSEITTIWITNWYWKRKIFKKEKE